VIGCTEGERSGIHALPGQGSVAPNIEGWACAARGLDPGGEPLRRHREHLEMHASGVVGPTATAPVGVSGVIRALYCDTNMQVKAGQLCAKIDPRPYQMS
jgi:hypothetical protein